MHINLTACARRDRVYGSVGVSAHAENPHWEINTLVTDLSKFSLVSYKNC